ncbi:hypothetical protein Acr_15g0013680 [Actinidia rufa]|uniref:Uncharacterized protein n=1 Tax=Actinidia rufa TaxID=165716 RepID=A0A7J0FX69_9ERIC|nr:hypothetical protein Acr_15g0013680 [Actinidia rufa]
MSDQEQERENIYYFQETEDGGGFESGAVNRLAQLSLSSFPTTPNPDSHHRTTTTDPRLRKSPSAPPRPAAAATVQGGNCTLHGFTKLPLPITSPIVWTSDPQPSGPTLRRCISDPINSPGTDKTKALGSQLSESCTVFASPLSPENAKTTPSPAKAISSASATLPPIGPILLQSISDPSPSGYQVKTTPPTSIKQENPNSEDEENEGSDERDESVVGRSIAPRRDDDSGSEDDKNCAPKDETETETESEEAVSVERSGNCLILHIKCPCGKGYQVLLSGRNCYYKLM